MTSGPITVIGAGNGGFALAADLTLHGHDVRLFSSPDHDRRLQEAIDHGGIEVSGPVLEGFAELSELTTDPKTAINGAELLIIAVPAFGHADIAERCLSHVSSGQTILLVPGYGSSLSFHAQLDAMGIADVTIAEAPVLPYACRIPAPGEVRITARFALLPAAYPAYDPDALIERLPDHFTIDPLQDVLEVAFTNPNPVIHPLPAILNTGGLDRTDGELSIYADGMTDRVRRAMFALDAERQSVLSTFGYEAMDLDAIYERFGSGPVYRQPMGTEADRFLERFITEDVPYGLRFWLDIGETVGVEMPVTRATIALAGALWESDYLDTGRTLDSLGGPTSDPLELFGKK